MTRVLIYGDSNSFGTMPMASFDDDGIFDKATRWGGVQAHGLADVDVVVEGLGGRTSVFDDPIEGDYRNGLRVLPAILHSHKPLDLLIIALGTNDQKARFALGAEDIALGIGRLAREACASGTVGQILMLAPPAFRPAGAFVEMFGGCETRCADLAARIETQTRREGVAFFDAGHVISVDPTDGIHWSAKAHHVLGTALIPVVRSLLAG
ncbi:MAG: GDSL-type esterase/lipase family protein [Silicimonas sp.]|nr:GDSL-type esterase/lipase family protein [Silicimonas sp.]